MNPSIASLAYVCGIAGLFYLDRDKSIRTSKALWLPVIYIWIIGSRPLSVWMGMRAPSAGDVQLDGSPVDRAFFLLLLIAAIGVLIRRGSGTLRLLTANWPVLFYFLFCLFSVFWSAYPGVALKRWIKAIGDVVMMLIVVTDERPVAALRRFFARTGFILLPLSVLFIKYYPYLGRSYDPWSGAQSVTGVTLNKNILGVVTYVLLLGAVWRVLSLLRAEEDIPNRGRHLLAQGAFLALGTYLLMTANSATSIVCFAIGAGLMLATGFGFARRHPSVVHILVLLLVVVSSTVILFGGGASAAQALGRNSTLTGRTEIWSDVIPLAPNALVGAGFESFWLNPQVHERLWSLMPGLPLNEAHDGYIEVYLELGWVGIALIALIFFSGYRRAVRAFRKKPILGGLVLAYILTAMVYNITEAGFRMLHPMWIFFLFAVVEASGIAADGYAGESQVTAAPLALNVGWRLKNSPALKTTGATASGEVGLRSFRPSGPSLRSNESGPEIGGSGNPKGRDLGAFQRRFPKWETKI